MRQETIAQNEESPSRAVQHATRCHQLSLLPDIRRDGVRAHRSDGRGRFNDTTIFDVSASNKQEKVVRLDAASRRTMFLRYSTVALLPKTYPAAVTKRAKETSRWNKTQAKTYMHTHPKSIRVALFAVSRQTCTLDKHQESRKGLLIVRFTFVSCIGTPLTHQKEGGYFIRYFIEHKGCGTRRSPACRGELSSAKEGGTRRAT